MNETETLDSMSWIGWYLTRDNGAVLRLDHSEYTVGELIGIDYRFYGTGSGKQEVSGITLLPPTDDIADLRGRMKALSFGRVLGYRMCGLDGKMADCLHRAYVGGSAEELREANRMIESHFC